MTDQQQALQAILEDYQAGEFSSVLVRADSLWRDADMAIRQKLILIIANTNLRSGHHEAAGLAFVEAARLLPEQRENFFKFAVNLFREAGLDARIADIAAEAAAAVPNAPDFVYGLAKACQNTGRLTEAAPFILQLDLQRPDHFACFNAFGDALGGQDAFYAFLNSACSSQPHNLFLQSIYFSLARQVCDFEAEKRFEDLVQDPQNALGQGLKRMELALMGLVRRSNERQQLDENYDTIALSSVAPDTPPPRRLFSSEKSKIRIGYLSCDFYRHVTMRLFEEVMLSHDRSRFDISLFCYTPPYLTHYQEDWPQFLRGQLVSVHDMTDADAAVAISARDIDILVDLKGFTGGTRMGIVKRSDAPVKVTYLGFPGTVPGADLDYAITDAIVTPDSARPFFAEKLCRLPETYQANGSHSRPHPLPISRADFGLPEGRFLLASFNAPYKLTAYAVRLWAKATRRLPDAALMMLCSSETARANIRNTFESEGVDPDRIIFFENETYDRFLARMTICDLALDCFYCNGHTTTSDLLWAGTPVLTMKGHHFSGRVSESLLRAAGLPELATENEEKFCDLAAALEGDRARLAAMHTHLQENRMNLPLFDTKRFTTHLESAYQIMAERARAGLSPDHFDVPVLDDLPHT